MEVFFARFSHLSEAIFDQLDAVNFAKCREVSWDWREYLADKRFLQIKVIRSLIGNVGQPWERFFKASNTDTIKQLRNAVERLYTNDWPEWKCDGHNWESRHNGKPLQLDESLTPLHVAATYKGRLAVYKYVHDITRDKNPISGDGSTPLH